MAILLALEIEIQNEIFR